MTKITNFIIQKYKIVLQDIIIKFFVKYIKMLLMYPQNSYSKSVLVKKSTLNMSKHQYVQLIHYKMCSKG